MSKPFDAALKELILRYPADWFKALGLPPPMAIKALEGELSSVAPQADKVFLVHDPEPWILHLEVQASRDPDLSARMALYNVLLWHRYRLPVESVVVLLRPEADGPGMTGTLMRPPPVGGVTRHEFRYRVDRVWEIPAAELLNGGLGTLPLAPVADMRGEDVGSITRRLEERLENEVPEAERPYVWTSAYLLLGLLYTKEQISQFLRGVRTMRESSTYQAILAEGEAKGLEKGMEKGMEKGLEKGLEKGRIVALREMVVDLGTNKFGDPSPGQEERIHQMDDYAALKALVAKLYTVGSWSELLP